MQRALITGITGQDGSYLTEFLVEKGYEVHGFPAVLRTVRKWTPDSTGSFRRLPTNETHTVREFVEAAFRELDITVKWEGQGIHEKGYDAETGKLLVDVNPEFAT